MDALAYDAWDRCNRTTINLLQLIPDDALALRTSEGGMTIGGLFAHLHGTRLWFLKHTIPEHALPGPRLEGAATLDKARLVEALQVSHRAVERAVRARVAEGRGTDHEFDHPFLLLHHLIWHDAYHHGQAKLALKLAGRAISDEVAGPVTWDLFIAKHGDAPTAPA